MLKRVTLRFSLRFGLLAVTAAGVLLATARLSAGLAGDSPPLSGAVADFNRIDPPLPAPGEAFRDGAGKVLHLADFRGKVVLLNVWATWCAPCRAEMPSLDRLQATMGGEGLVIAAGVAGPRRRAGGRRLLRPARHHPSRRLSRGQGRPLAGAPDRRGAHELSDRPRRAAGGQPGGGDPMGCARIPRPHPILSGAAPGERRRPHP